MLRRLERRLILHRAQLGITEIVDRQLFLWEQAVRADRPPPNPLHLPSRLAAAGLRPPTLGAAVTYLEECHRARSVPDRLHLLRTLLPWAIGQFPHTPAEPRVSED